VPGGAEGIRTPDLLNAMQGTEQSPCTASTGDNVWDTNQSINTSAWSPAGTLVATLSEEDRPTRRHNVSRRRAKTSKLGVHQRRFLVGLLEAVEARLEDGVHTYDTFIPWRPSKDPLPGFTPTEAPVLSSNLRILEARQLIKARRHEGGRAHAVALMKEGLEYAVFLSAYGRTEYQQRRKLMAFFPKEVLAFIPLANAERRRRGTTAQRKSDLQHFLNLYRAWHAMFMDPEHPGPGSVEEMMAHVSLIVELQKQLTS
jgi:hypothetical protein